MRLMPTFSSRNYSAVAAAVMLWAARQQVYAPIRPNSSQSVPMKPSQGRIEKVRKINGQSFQPSQCPKKPPCALAPVRTHARAYAQARGITPTFLGRIGTLGRIKGRRR